MQFEWIDYSPEFERTVDSWLDEDAVRSTGLDEGFGSFFRYWIKEDGTRYRENFWVKIIQKKTVPVGVIAVGLSENSFILSELVISPGFRRKGLGSSALSEFIGSSEDIVGVRCDRATAVIFPDNIASQKAFEKAGFRYVSEHPDGDAWYYEFDRDC